MADTILIGRGDRILEVPADGWRAALVGARQRCEARFSFMAPDHHRVRYFAVRELPRNQGRPLAPEDIARRLDIPLPGVRTILEELERHLFFLVRNDAGAVSWAYPVTVDPTPHRLSFSSGETLWGA